MATLQSSCTSDNMTLVSAPGFASQLISVDSDGSTDSGAFSESTSKRFFVSALMKSCNPIARGVGLAIFLGRWKLCESLTAKQPSKMPSKVTAATGPSSMALMPFCLPGQLRE